MSPQLLKISTTLLFLASKLCGAWVVPASSETSLSESFSGSTSSYAVESPYNIPQPHTDAQQIISSDEPVVINKGAVVQAHVTYTFDGKSFKVAATPIRLNYIDADGNSKSIDKVTNDDGDVAIIAPNWPDHGTTFTLTIILDYNIDHRPYRIVGSGSEPTQPAGQVIMFSQQFPSKKPSTIEVDFDINSQSEKNVQVFRLGELIRDFATKTIKNFGLDLEPLTVVYPVEGNDRGEFGVPSPGQPELYIGALATRMVMAHEWGHYFQYLAQGGHYLSYGGANGHLPCQQHPQTPLTAFGEGFASAYALIMENVVNGILVDDIYDINFELYTCDLDDMNTDEGRFTAALFDLWDDADDKPNGNKQLGDVEYQDGNHGLTLSPKQILLDPIRAALKNEGADKYLSSPQKYWESLEKTLQKSGETDKLEKAKEIFKYNYGKFVA